MSVFRTEAGFGWLPEDTWLLDKIVEITEQMEGATDAEVDGAIQLFLAGLYADSRSKLN
jgi:hypothetical protein